MDKLAIGDAAHAHAGRRHVPPQSGQACPSCGATTRTLALCGRDHLYGNPGTFRVERCDGCGLGIQHPMPSDEQLAAFYPDTYACHAWREPCPDWVVAMKRMLLCDAGPREPRLTKIGRVLDVGCGAGAALVPFRRRGWDTVGLEPDARAVRVGREHGLRIEHGTLETVAFPDESFDYVRMDHSLEHVARPLQSLLIVRRLLRPGGRIFVAVPEFESTTRCWFGEYWWFLGLPVHTYHYSRGTLPPLLERAGFTIENVRIRPHLGGTLGSASLALNHGRRAGEYRIDLMKFAFCRLLGQWVAGLIALCGTGDVVEVTAVRPPNGDGQ